MRLARVTTTGSARTAAVLAAALTLTWVISPAAGGQQHMSPLWLMLPVLWAALNLSMVAAVPVALIAGLLAGPLTPDDVRAGTDQPLAVWGVRAAFFVLVAVVTSHAVARLRATGLHDPLTGLLNRAALTPSLERSLERARRAGGSVGLVCIDLDDFKLVNDSLGHAAGDRLLREVGRRLQEATRGGDVLARHGGDEFIVVLERLGADTDEAVAERRATAAVERLVDALGGSLVAGTDLRIGCSIGFSLYPFDGTDQDGLHRKADAAMYAAKTSRRPWARYAASAQDPLVRLSRASRLRAAVEAGDLELHYQPVWRVGGGIMGVEALVRWRDGDAGPIAPSEFIALAEETGVIEALGDWVLRETAGQARAWREQGLCPHVGVNVAPWQLRQPQFAERTMAVLDAHGLDPAGFVIELTESAWTIEGNRTLPTLAALRAAGFPLALDDFGAGYSSLSRLRKLPVDVIKIDRSFLCDVPYDRQSVAVMIAIFELAAACGADVVAEGVETEAQYAFLAEHGCRLVQGYALARPAPVAEITGLLHARLEPSRRAEPLAAAATT